VPLLAGGINFQVVHSGLGLTPSFLQRLCEILAFTLTLISACRCMSSDLSRVASQSYVSYAAFDDLSNHLCISRWSLPWSYRDWTTVMRHWLVFQPACLTVSSPSSMLQLGRSPVSIARSILQMLSPVSTGFVCIKFKLAVLVYRALHGIAPQYLSGQLQYVADLPSRRRGWSTSSLLDIRPSRLVTVGDRSFAAAGPRLWRSLPVDIQSAQSLTTFRRKLKTHLFLQS